MRIALIGDFDTFVCRGRERPLELLPYRLSPGLNLLRGFQELGIGDVHIVVDTPEVRRSVVEDGPFGTLHRLPSPRFSGTASFQLWRRHMLLQELCRIRPDIVHGHGTEGEYAFTAVTSPYPNVITFHGIMHRISRIVRPPLFSPLHIARWLEKIVVRRATDVICISSEAGDFLSECGSAARCHYIPNAVAPCFFGVAPASAAPAELRVVFLGTIYRLKGVIELVQAVARLQNQLDRPIRLQLVGPIGGGDRASYARELRRQIGELHLEGLVDWLGSLSEQAVADVLARSDVLALPSYQETAPMCIAEAMAAGRPVVATRVGGIPNQVDDGQTGLLVSPGNVAELTDALRAILADEPLRRRMGSAGRAKAVANYAPRLVAEKTLAVYEGVCMRSGPP